MNIKLCEEVYLKHDEGTDCYYLFCISSGKHFSLNETSYEILMLLKMGKDKQEIAEFISNHYNVTVDLCKKDIDTLIDVLQENNLLINKEI